MSRRAATADPAPSSPTESSPSFEEAMVELESIVQAMDDDSLPLESLLAQYSRGRGLLKFCQTQIQDAQQRVELINAQADGTTTLEPFHPAPAALVSPQSLSRPARPGRPTSAPEPEDDLPDFS